MVDLLIKQLAPRKQNQMEQDPMGIYETKASSMKTAEAKKNMRT